MIVSATPRKDGSIVHSISFPNGTDFETNEHHIETFLDRFLAVPTDKIGAVTFTAVQLA